MYVRSFLFVRVEFLKCVFLNKSRYVSQIYKSTEINPPHYTSYRCKSSPSWCSTSMCRLEQHHRTAGRLRNSFPATTSIHVRVVSIFYMSRTDIGISSTSTPRCRVDLESFGRLLGTFCQEIYTNSRPAYFPKVKADFYNDKVLKRQAVR